MEQTPQEWYSPRSLAGLPGMPLSSKTLIRRVDRGCYPGSVVLKTPQRRRILIHRSALPPETREALELA